MPNERISQNVFVSALFRTLNESPFSLARFRGPLTKEFRLSLSLRNGRLWQRKRRTAHFLSLRTFGGDTRVHSVDSYLQYYLRYAGFEKAWDTVKCDGAVAVGVIDSGIVL